jgi:transcriptional regulator with XRE-family HTH domain
MMPEEPLSYWVSVARIGFEDDFNRLFEELDISQAELARKVNPPVSEAYVSKLLNGTAGNYELKTMVKWARVVGGVVQVRIIKEEGEVVRVVDYETAQELDDKRMIESSDQVLADIVDIRDYMPAGDRRRIERKTLSARESQLPLVHDLAEGHG